MRNSVDMLSLPGSYKGLMCIHLTSCSVTLSLLHAAHRVQMKITMHIQKRLVVNQNQQTLSLTIKLQH